MKKMNVKLLRKIQRHILAEPRRYNQNLWREEVDPADDNHPACGTIACIGGWANVLTGHGAGSSGSWWQAQTALGLTCEQAGRLFDSVSAIPDDMWPRKFARAYTNARRPLTRARIAVRRIDHFIKTKGAE